jgi:GTP cyclohydrolase II
MNETNTAQALAAEPSLADVRVDRAITELLHGRPVRLLEADGAVWLVSAVESLTQARLDGLAALGSPLQLLLGGERRGPPTNAAQAPGPLRIALPMGITLDALLQLADVTPLGEPLEDAPERQRSAAAAEPAHGAGFTSALLLARRARLAPALLILAETDAAQPRIAQAQWLSLSVSDLQQSQPAPVPTLRRISDAHVPLAAREDCELALFREENGGAEHLAVIVGQVDVSRPVAVRLHSSCLTGDLLGSLRCDCGEQLHRAVERLAAEGGVLLYLEQEGRSIGLANKLRAYRLQDAGLDTLQANSHLGFAADERDYGAAVAMLRALGISRIRLLTNNPNKIEALAAGGIEVVERLSLHAPVNPHNARYIETKQQIAGHLKDD